MLLSAVDPALLFYRLEECHAQEQHCLGRYEALMLHLDVSQRYGQGIALSCELEALMSQSFPWDGRWRDVEQLRDFAQVLLERLPRLRRYVDDDSAGIAAREAILEPAEVVCRGVGVPEVVDAWMRLLCLCVSERVLADCAPQIATWDDGSLPRCPERILLTLCAPQAQGDAHTFCFPAVWDRDSWARQLCTQAWWPNLHRCVELHFATNRALRDFPGVREQPISFEVTRTFERSLERYCQLDRLRRALVEALTKRVYGVLDRALGDEPFGGVRRFRVTRSWRVHYREEGPTLVLEEFGPHDMRPGS